MEDIRAYTPQEREQIERFIKALNHVMVASRVSQRGLAEILGVSVGTITKYLRGTVPPLNVCLEIQWKLSRALGVTLDALVSFYETGEYLTAITLEDVASWIRSDAGQESWPALMACLSDAAQRLAPAAHCAEVVEEVRVIWDWPVLEVLEAGLTPRMRERLTLTDDRLQALAERGEFDDELVEGFAVACNYQVDAVRAAFERQEAIV